MCFRDSLCCECENASLILAAFLVFESACDLADLAGFRTRARASLRLVAIAYFIKAVIGLLIRDLGLRA